MSLCPPLVVVPNNCVDQNLPLERYQSAVPSYCVRNPISTKSECCVNENIARQIFRQTLKGQDELLKTMLASVRNTEASLGM